MKRQSLVVVVFFIGTLLAYLPSYSQSIFVKVTDETGAVLSGSSLVVGFAGQTEILSFGQGSSACGIPAGPGGGCIPTTENFIYNFVIDQTITDYRKALYLTKKWRRVEISFTRQAGSTGSIFTYEKILLEDVYVTGLTEAAANGDIPIFQVSFDPSKITWTFIPQTGGGGAGTPRSFGYNRITNTSF